MIQPSKDPAIIFLCRVLKQFLIRDDHRLYYNRLKNALSNEYNVSSKALSHLIRIFNSIQKATFGKFTYLKKSGPDKSDSRCFLLHEQKSKKINGLRQMQKFRQHLKYSAWQYQTEAEIKQEQKIEKELNWEWVGNGKYKNKDNITEYTAVTNGMDEYHVNDIIELNHSKGVSPRPWIARIIQIYESKEEKKINVRWFWFYNQLRDVCNGNEEIKNCTKNVRDTMGNDNFPPTAADIFESVIEDEMDRSEEPVICIKNKVHLVSKECPKSRKYEKMVNGQDVFFCDYFVDINKKRLIKKKKEEIIGDYKRLQNHNYNVDLENEDDDSSSNSDI